MTVASRAVMMAVMTEARTVDEAEQFCEIVVDTAGCQYVHVCYVKTLTAIHTK